MLTPEQREERKKYIGSSDLAAIVGLDPWSNNSDVYIEKTGVLELEAEDNSLPADIGQIFENGVLQLFAKVKNVALKQNIFLTHEMFCANLDAFIEAEHEIVEAKTHGDPDDYGAEGTDEIPDSQIIQVHEQMYVVSMATHRECKIAWVPVLLPGYKSLQFKIYKVQRNDNLMNDLVSVGQSFWNNHVLPRIPPAPYQPSLQLLKRVRRIAEQIADLKEEMIDDWQDAVEREYVAKKGLDEAKSRLLAAIGDGDAGESKSGRMVTYFEQHRGGYTVEPTSYRVLRLKSAKKIKRGK